ncbi:hypothetical protein BV20DRAFT_1048639 [Pilatotrama ljubarskyi]|nr:hypothetical protein BV20DRAFT_1048639 [Pilatotrama ljubarskyi]
MAPRTRGSSRRGGSPGPTASNNQSSALSRVPAGLTQQSQSIRSKTAAGQQSGTSSRLSRGAPERHAQPQRDKSPVQNDAHSVTSDHSPPQVRHQYGTRRTTQTAHPAAAVGLAKRTRQEIHAAAVQKAAERSRRQEEKTREAERVATGTRRLEQMQQEHALQLAEEEQYLRTPLQNLRGIASQSRLGSSTGQEVGNPGTATAPNRSTNARAAQKAHTRPVPTSNTPHAAAPQPLPVDTQLNKGARDAVEPRSSVPARGACTTGVLGMLQSYGGLSSDSGEDDIDLRFTGASYRGTGPRSQVRISPMTSTTFNLESSPLRSTKVAQQAAWDSEEESQPIRPRRLSRTRVFFDSEDEETPNANAALEDDAAPFEDDGTFGHDPAFRDNMGLPDDVGPADDADLPADDADLPADDADPPDDFALADDTAFADDFALADDAALEDDLTFEEDPALEGDDVPLNDAPPERDTPIKGVMAQRPRQCLRAPAESRNHLAKAVPHKRQRTERSLSPRRKLQSSSKKQRATNGNAFRPGWKQPQANAFPPFTPPTLSRSGHRPACWRAVLEPQHTDLAIPPIGQAANYSPHPAFTDADVSFDREYAISAAGHQGKSKVLVQAVDTDANTDLSTEGRQKGRRRRRRAPADVPKDESRSIRNLPDFVKPFLDTEIVPTVINYVGTKRDPWDMREHGRDELLRICQEVLELVCPRDAYDLEKDDVIYKVVRQKVYQWRSGFANAAIAVIGEAMDLKFGQKPSRPAVQRWVTAAIADGGEAFWAHPHSDPQQAHGKLQSIYILRCFATHLEATTGAVKDYGYPGGALALSVAAVKHCFPMFREGKFKPGKPFCSQNARASTESWYDTSVYRFVNKPEHFDAIIRMASKHRGAPKRQKAPVDGAQAPSVFDRSSPPVESFPAATRSRHPFVPVRVTRSFPSRLILHY